MGGIVKSVTGAVSSIFGGGSDDTAEAATTAANIQSQAQMEALQYLKETNAVPQQYKEQALRQLGNMTTAQQLSSTEQLLSQAKTGGLYDALLSGQEEAALRAQSATGGLRGGQSISSVGSVQNQALLQAYQNEANREQQQMALNQQNIGNLQSLAGLSTNENQIANMISGIGQTQSQGVIAAAQNQQATNQAGFGNLMGIGQLGLGAALAFSDERLKDEITKTGEVNGIPTFKWKWNEKAEKLGLKGQGFGTLSRFVKQVMPEAVTEKDGYDQVNYEMIGVNHG